MLENAVITREGHFRILNPKKPVSVWTGSTVWIRFD